MVSRDFLKAGHPPTLLAAFLYFDASFMVWVMPGPLAVQIARDLHLDAAQRSLMVAVPVLAGALLRMVNGIAVDRIGPRLTGAIGQLVVIAGLLAAWWFGIHGFAQVLLLGVVLGQAGASFAVALPLASRWYPPEMQGIFVIFCGFYLASSLGYSKQLTGSYQAGFLLFAALAALALLGLTGVKTRWRTTWGRAAVARI